MFHIYEGFHLVDAYHKVRHQRKYHPEDSAKRVVKIAISCSGIFRRNGSVFRT